MGTVNWVPLVTAAAGLIAGLAAGLVSTVLARRWATEDRAAQWQREDTLRWQADRLQAYARMISALDAWNAEIGRLLGANKDAEAFDAARWGRHYEAVSELVALVSLMAPENVTGLAQQCLVAFATAGATLDMAGHDSPADFSTPEWAAAEAGARSASRAISRLTEAMRADLGLGDSAPPAAGTGPRPPR